MNPTAIQSVPTNIITGFLGVGKTSAILHLLENKPGNERWAVLVNEFGEIGVDGSLFEGLHSKDRRVFIREVPGGCMCCAAGLPMQIALSQLLSKAKPDRLLIEPTGLGHPFEVLAVLSAPHYKDVLSLQNTLTLVDARKLSDNRYTDHDSFNQQIAMGDIVIGNKQDLYEPEDQAKLEAYVKLVGYPEARILFTQKGQISSRLLSGAATAGPSALAARPEAINGHDHHPAEARILISDATIPECGYLRANNQGEGFQSIGWRFSADKVFSLDKIRSFLSSINAERMKAVFITEAGVYGFNLTTDVLTEIPLDDCMESRIEIIGQETDNNWEKQLMSCFFSE